MMNIDIAKIPYIKTEIPGPKSKALLDEQRRYETASVTYPRSFPIAIRYAKDSLI